MSNRSIFQRLQEAAASADKEANATTDDRTAHYREGQAAGLRAALAMLDDLDGGLVNYLTPIARNAAAGLVKRGFSARLGHHVRVAGDVVADQERSGDAVRIEERRQARIVEAMALAALLDRARRGEGKA